MSRVDALCVMAVLITSVALSACDVLIDRGELRVEEYEGPDLTADEVTGPWTAEVDGKDVTLTLGPAHINTDSMSIVIKLQDNPGSLPALKDVWHGPYGGGLGAPVRNATVEIHGWDVAGVISGAIRAQLPNALRMRELFWIDLSDE